MTSTSNADVVVVGGGTVGAWTAVLLAESGVGHVVLLEAGTLGDGASSRAAGMVRAQGGTETAIRLGLRTQDFYDSTRVRFPLDCGFVRQGYLMPCFTDAEVTQAHERIALQKTLGLEVEWLTSSAVDDRNTGIAPGATLGASYAPGDGYIDAPRNVLAYSAALAVHGVAVRERCAFTGLRRSGGRVVGVDTSGGPIDTERVVLTGGPQLAQVGVAAGGRIPAGGTRHQVVVTAPLPVDVHQLPMVFDVMSGIYWRPGESGGLLWGMSNPDEPPGVAVDFDTVYYRKARDRMEEIFPAIIGLGLRRAWAATIDYTPDHLPILGPLVDDDGGPIEGTVVASAAGHGMMWGPAVAQVAADLATTGECDWLDLTDLGLDRFDAEGNSRVAPEPISLPFPEHVAAERILS